MKRVEMQASTVSITKQELGILLVSLEHYAAMAEQKANSVDLSLAESWNSERKAVTDLKHKLLTANSDKEVSRDEFPTY